jgi:DNA-directed RNA polymerase subunit RPC12/RpoP
MSENAKDIENGLCCGICGQYFEDAQGYPAVCGDCWKDMTEKEKKGWQKSHSKTLGD